jgi:drug/metabolite transporter (DMT)-like permease
MDNPFRGIALLLGATMFFSVSDSIAKLLGQSLPAIEITWIRYVIFLVMAAMLVAPRGGRGSRMVAAMQRLRVRSLRLQLARGVGLVLSAVLFIEALKFLPLADAAAVGFVSPLLITALSVPILHEVVGLRRWIAIVVGLAGVLVIVQPGTGAFQPAALLVVGSSAAWALASVLTRKMAATDDAATTLLYSAMVGLAALSVLLPFDYVLPDLRQLLLCLALGIIASTGQYLMVLAYRYAGASLLAPFSYIQLLWATGLGWLIFDALPDRWTLLGAAIIVASGLYTVHRERVRAREKVAASG